MCGIAGYISSEAADADVLHKMLAAIGHRGPDGFSGFVEGPLAMGTARLAIVDLAGGTQPAVSENRKVALVFNGEIFNYMELRAELGRKGVSFRTRSEVETLLHLYLEFGLAFLSRLNGQFAMAIWDGRQNRIHLCRDRFGIRPLFFCKLSGRGIAFASEAKGLFAHGKVAASIAPESLGQTFRLWTNVGNTSAFRGVRQVPPAHVLTLDADGNESLTQYWEWQFPDEIEPIMLPSDEDYFSMFRAEFDSAIQRQRMADVAVGCYLSGGVDSSVVAARLAASQDAHTTYSVSFQDAEYDESSAQRTIAAHLGVTSITEEVSNAAIAAVFPQVVWQAETPLFRTAPAPLFLLSKRVHADGVKVVMTGEGADEMLLGYDLFREVEIRQFWSRQPDSLWRPNLLSRLYSYLPQYRNPRYFGMIKDFYRHTLDTGSRHFAMSVRWSNGKALEQYFSADMKAFAQDYDPVTELDRWLPASYGSTGHVSRAQCIEIQTLLSNYLLSSQGDRMSMAHGVEGRYPYLDNKFVDFVTRLPRRIKLRGLKDKFILRNAFKDTIPDTVRMRPKVAYQAPDIRAFFSAGRAPDYVSDLLAPAKIREAGFFDPDKVSFLFKKGLTYQLDRAGTRDSMAFTLILSTMLLYDIFVLGNRSMSPDIRIPSTLTLV